MEDLFIFIFYYFWQNYCHHVKSYKTADKQNLGIKLIFIISCFSLLAYVERPYQSCLPWGSCNKPQQHTLIGEKISNLSTPKVLAIWIYKTDTEVWNTRTKTICTCTHHIWCRSTLPNYIEVDHIKVTADLMLCTGVSVLVSVVHMSNVAKNADRRIVKILSLG